MTTNKEDLEFIAGQSVETFELLIEQFSEVRAMQEVMWSMLTPIIADQRGCCVESTVADGNAMYIELANGFENRMREAAGLEPLAEPRQLGPSALGFDWSIATEQ